MTLSDNLLLARCRSDKKAFLTGGFLKVIRSSTIKNAAKRISTSMDVRKAGTIR